MTNFVTCCRSCDETIVIGDSDSESPLPEFSVEISPPDSDQIPIYTPTESSGSQTSAANSSRFGNRDNNDTVTSLASTLHAHSGRIIHGVPLALDLSREGLFVQAVSFYKAASTEQLSRPLRVRFEGEEGIDAGGLRREFFKQLFQLITAPDRGLFEGPPRKLWPVHNVMAVRTRLFKMVGLAMAHSVTQCDMGMSFLAPGLFTFLLSENEEDALVETRLEDMPESNTKHMLVEVSSLSPRCVCSELIAFHL